MKIPANLQPWVQAVGADAACDLFLALGGAQIYLPSAPKPGSMLVDAAGIENAARICRALGPGYVKVPLAREWTAAHLKQERGLTTAEIARIVRADEATVRRWFNGGDHKGQLSLL